MNRRTAITATTTAAVLAATLTACTPDYPGGNTTGITLAHGTVTGEMVLVCQPPPTPGQPQPVQLALYYRHAGGDWQDTYSVTAPCKIGQWYIGEAVNGAAIHGPVVHITNCGQTID